MKKLYIILTLLCFAVLMLTAIEGLKLSTEADAITTNTSDKQTETKIEDEIKEEIKEESEVEEINFKVYQTPNTTGFKSFMDFKTITDKTTKQYELQNTYAYTGNYGIRMANNRYCIALGTYYGAEIGQYVDLVLDNDVTIHCILADIKDDKHTDSNNIVTLHNGCATEFIIDGDMLLDSVKIYGDISYSDSNWGSPVKEVVVYEENVFN